MKLFFSDLFIINSISALVILGIFSYKNRNCKNYMLHVMAVASAIWSFGFGLLALQTDSYIGHICKSVAIFGTFMYMVSAQYLLNMISGINRKVAFIFDIVALLGAPVYILSIQRSQTIYYVSNYGMTYNFVPGLISTLYFAYFGIVCVNLLIVIIYMIRSSREKKVRFFGKCFLIVAILVYAGTVLDMVFPVIGMAAVPGSNITQFWGLLVVFYAYNNVAKSEISIGNFAHYIYSSLAACIMVFDRNDNLKIANDAACEFVHFNKKDMNSREVKLTDFFDMSLDSSFLDSPEYISIDSRTLVGNVPVNLNISTIYDRYKDPIGYIVAIKDLTLRMEYIENLKKAREEADLANMAKTRFLANMSHEIRTPMNSIIGFSDIILTQDMDRDELMDSVRNIKNSSYGLLSIINDILDISKIESGKMELDCVQYSLKDMLSASINQIRPLAQNKGLQLNTDIDEKLPSVLSGDCTKIMEVVVNILNNAVKYTDKGSILLSVSGESEPYGAGDKMSLTFIVKDTGRGIAADNVDKIFDAFEQVGKKNDHIEGTGLGLAIVKGYLGLMDGSVKVDSKLGMGTTFTVSIPQEVVDSQPVGNLNEKKADNTVGVDDINYEGINILIVDDNGVNLMVATKLLRKYGFRIDQADSGEKAVEMCKSKKYRLIFMDQMMPGMSGIEAMEIIRANDSYYSMENEGRIVVLTADAIKGVREELLGMGFDEYIEKPIDIPALENVLKRMLG